MHRRDLDVFCQVSRVPAKEIAKAWIADYQAENECDYWKALEAWNQFINTPLVKIHEALFEAGWALYRFTHPIISIRVRPEKYCCNRRSLRFWIKFDDFTKPADAVHDGEVNTPYLNGEITFPGGYPGFKFRAGGWGEDDDFSLYLGIGILNFHFGFENFLPRKWLPKFRRELGIQWFHEFIWIDLWSTEQICGDEPDNKPWQDISICPPDRLFGPMKYESTVVEERELLICMPEKVYRAQAQLTDDTWKRPRLPWRRVVRRAHVEIPEGIPFPGKGENDWDCDDDAQYGATLPAESLEEAETLIRQNILEMRQERGGRNWMPEGGWK